MSMTCICIRQQEILIVAIANLHRNPDYWKDRL